LMLCFVLVFTMTVSVFSEAHAPQAEPAAAEAPAPATEEAHEPEAPPPAGEDTPAPAEESLESAEPAEAPDETATPEPTEEPAPEETEAPETVDYAKSVHENPLFVSGYVRVLKDHAPVSLEPLGDPLYSLPKDAVLYLVSWKPGEELSFAQVLFPSDDGEWYSFCMDASLLRPLADEEVSAFIQGLQSPAFFIEGDAKRPILPVPLLPILARTNSLLSLQRKDLRAEPLWEGGFPETLGDDALLDTQNPDGLSLRRAFSDAFSAHAQDLDLSGYQLTDVQVQSALQAFLDENLSFFHVSGNFAVEAQAGLVLSLYPQYRMDAERWSQSKAAQQSAVAALISAPPREDSTLGRIVSIHDLFCGKYTYADGGGQYDAFALFAQGEGESQAVSMALHAAMQALHIPSIIVRSAEMGHVWNMVQLNGNWYHIDLSLDMAGSYGAFIQYDYLLLSEKGLSARPANHRNWLPGRAATDTT
jgi:hypothetical protein